MANLLGRLQGSRKEVTRLGHEDIVSKLETWNGSIQVVLRKDGVFNVFIGDKSYPGTLIASGNVDDKSWTGFLDPNRKQKMNL